MTSQPRKYDDDDGRVICNMDVEGMRWHDRRKVPERVAMLMPHASDQMSPAEARKYTWYAVLAGLTVVGVFSAALVLFTLFCIYVWFR